MATIQELLALARANAALRASQQTKQNSLAAPPATEGRYGHASVAGAASPLAAAPLANLASRSAAALTFNTEQLSAIELALEGKSFCLIGAAGTGKTTVTQEIIKRIQTSSHITTLTEATKHLDKDAPAIVICGYTNKAVSNIKKKLPAHLQRHCITVHKLVEYAPVYFEVLNEQTGNIAATMRFEPSRSAANPLPHISTIIFEESSMIGTDLYAKVIDALPAPHSTQFIFLGDLNQLPPVFGPSILGFKLGDLPIVELTQVYRQALLSPIISLATAVRKNEADNLPKALTELTTKDGAEHGVVTIKPWKKRIDTIALTPLLPKIIAQMIADGMYDLDSDMMLCPFNVGFGTIEINKAVADYRAKRDGAVVYEVIARYTKSYWAVGDRVFVDRHEGIITKIETTPGYVGKLPRPESATLDRNGKDSSMPHIDFSALTADEILNQIPDSSDDDDAKNLASHTITVFIPDLDTEYKLDTAGEINNMLFGYCLTVHKSQGSEWHKVILMFHNSHATMLSRELVYTAVTRAKHELLIICEGDTKPYQNSIAAAAARPRIPGNSLRDKIEFFRQKAREFIN